MPTYRYKCTECENIFEEKLPVSKADAPVACPKGHSKTRRIFTVPSVVYKGKGFYSTDHRSKPASAD